MAATLSSSSCNQLLHHLRRPPQQPPSVSCPIFSFLVKPLLGCSAPATSRTLALPISAATSSIISSSSPSLLYSLTSKPVFVSPSSLPLRRSLCSSSAAFTQTPTDPEYAENDDDADVGAARNEDVASESDEGGKGTEAVEEESVILPRALPAKEKPPILSVKEKKELASYAHSLGKKLTTQLVGKSGLTVNVAASFIENLESNELLKIKIHRTCPGELEEVVNELEICTGSVVVSKVGRTVIIYRPSLTKLKAEEKKQQARRVYVRKESQPRLAAILRKGQARGVSRPPPRGQRGSSSRAVRSYSAASS